MYDLHLFLEGFLHVKIRFFANDYSLGVNVRKAGNKTERFFCEKNLMSAGFQLSSPGMLQ
jgi:hypothetical protein